MAIHDRDLDGAMSELGIGTGFDAKTTTDLRQKTYAEFTGLVRALLEPKASEKGYSGGGPDGQNPLYEFVSEMNVGDGHALGEIVYKAKRFAAKGNEEDILKVAAWAFLVWRHRAR